MSPVDPICVAYTNPAARWRNRVRISFGRRLITNNWSRSVLEDLRLGRTVAVTPLRWAFDAPDGPLSVVLKNSETFGTPNTPNTPENPT